MFFWGGDSIFYNHMVDAEFYIKDMLQNWLTLTYHRRLSEKRNSKNGLYEYLIAAENFLKKNKKKHQKYLQSQKKALSL